MIAKAHGWAVKSMHIMMKVQTLVVVSWLYYNWYKNSKKTADSVCVWMWGVCVYLWHVQVSCIYVKIQFSSMVVGKHKPKGKLKAENLECPNRIFWKSQKWLFLKSGRQEWGWETSTFLYSHGGHKQLILSQNKN